MRWLLLVGLAGGCAALMTSAQKREDLMDDLRDYQEGLVWKNYDKAANFLPAHDREVFLDAHDATDDEMSVDEYDIQRVVMVGKQDRAKVQVRFRWHLDSEGIVHETTVQEDWSMGGAHKGWMLTALHKKHGKDMPLIQNSAPAADDAAADDDRPQPQAASR